MAGFSSIVLSEAQISVMRSLMLDAIGTTAESPSPSKWPMLPSRAVITHVSSTARLDEVGDPEKDDRSDFDMATLNSLLASHLINSKRLSASIILRYTEPMSNL